MADGFSLTQPRRPTFSERMRLTYALFLMRLPLCSGWLGILWSSGAIASFSPIDRLPAKLLIENDRKSIEITISKRHVTAE